MPVFQYKARDMQGLLVTRTLAFASEPALREYLRQHSLYVVEVNEQRPSGLSALFTPGVRLGELVVLVRQLRTLILAGMPLVSGLEALAEQSMNQRLAEVLGQVARAVGHGASLAATLEQYPRIFPGLLVELVRSGEEAGRLPETLEEAARQFELQLEIRQKLVSVLVYSTFTLVATVGTVLFMLLFVVPVFADVYRDLNAPLPWITRSLLGVSAFLQSWFWLILLVTLAGAGLFVRWVGTPEGRCRVDAWKLRVPLLDPLFLKAASARLTGSLAGLLESGVPLVQSLTVAARVSGNTVLSDAVRSATQSVIAGRRLSAELEECAAAPHAHRRGSRPGEHPGGAGGDPHAEGPSGDQRNLSDRR